MARKRMIDPSFWTDEKLGECNVSERLLFMGLISNADDEGYGRANPKLLKSLVFPYDDLRTSDLEKWLSRLGGLNLIALYEESEQTYYYLPNFSKHQTINKPTPSTFPKPTEGTTVALREDYGSPTVALPPKRREEKRREHPLPPQGESADFFKEFWEAYPRKTAKPNALRAFEKLKPDRLLLEVMLAALSVQKQSAQWVRDGGQYIPHPATWLNQRRWEDESPEPEPPKPPDTAGEQLRRYPKLGEW